MCAAGESRFSNGGEIRPREEMGSVKEPGDASGRTHTRNHSAPAEYQSELVTAAPGAAERLDHKDAERRPRTNDFEPMTEHRGLFLEEAAIAP